MKVILDDPPFLAGAAGICAATIALGGLLYANGARIERKYEALINAPSAHTLLLQNANALDNADNWLGSADRELTHYTTYVLVGKVMVPQIHFPNAHAAASNLAAARSWVHQVRALPDTPALETRLGEIRTSVAAKNSISASAYTRDRADIARVSGQVSADAQRMKAALPAPVRAEYASSRTWYTANTISGAVIGGVGAIGLAGLGVVCAMDWVSDWNDRRRARKYGGRYW